MEQKWILVLLKDSVNLDTPLVGYTYLCFSLPTKRGVCQTHLVFSLNVWRLKLNLHRHGQIIPNTILGTFPVYNTIFEVHSLCMWVVAVGALGNTLHPAPNFRFCLQYLFHLLSCLKHSSRSHDNAGNVSGNKPGVTHLVWYPMVWARMLLHVIIH